MLPENPAPLAHVVVVVDVFGDEAVVLVGRGVVHSGPNRHLPLHDPVGLAPTAPLLANTLPGTVSLEPGPEKRANKHLHQSFFSLFHLKACFDSRVSFGLFF